MKIILMVLIGVGIMYLATLKAQDKSISGGAYPTVSPKTEPIVVKGSGGSNPDPFWTKEDYEAKAKDNNREVMSAVISRGLGATMGTGGGGPRGPIGWVGRDGLFYKSKEDYEMSTVKSGGGAGWIDRDGKHHTGIIIEP